MSSKFTWSYNRLRKAILLNFPNGEQLSITVAASDIDNITGLMLQQERRKTPFDAIIPTDASGNPEVEDYSLDSDMHDIDREEA
jgi:hypothetical protein